MKRYFIILMACLAVFAFTACSDKKEEPTETKSEKETVTQENTKETENVTVEVGDEPLTLGFSDDDNNDSSNGDNSGNGESGSSNPSEGSDPATGENNDGTGETPLPPILGGDDEDAVVETPLIPLS